MPQYPTDIMHPSVSSGKEHNHTIDFVRGILIILVVIGHVIRNSVPRYLIYAFHMPLFLFLVGYLIHNEAGKGYLLKKSKRFVIPFAAASIFYFIWWSATTPVNKLSLFARMFLIPPHHLWFLYAAFFHFLFIYGVIVLQQKKKEWPVWPAIVLISVVLFVLSKWIPPYSLFEAKRVFGFFIFTLAGFLYRHKMMFDRISTALQNNRILFFVPLLVFLASLLGQYMVDSSTAGFPSLAVMYNLSSYLLFGLGNLALGLFVGLAAEQWSKVALPIINHIGQNSLVVYLYHFVVFQILALYAVPSVTIILVSITVPLLAHRLLKNHPWYQKIVLGL